MHLLICHLLIQQLTQLFGPSLRLVGVIEAKMYVRGSYSPSVAHYFHFQVFILTHPVQQSRYSILA